MLKKDKLIITNENPFENDLLDREYIADNLTKIIDSLDGNFVISIDSSWGTGKTTFIQMWERKLKLNKEYFTLYFNAWKNDFHNNVFLSLFGEINKQLESIDIVNNDNVKKEDIAKVATSIGNNVLKLLTSDIIDLKDIYKDLKEDSYRKLYDEYNKYNEVKEELYMNLCNLKTKLRVKKVIFFIDELDRCRPNYAIETLEVIKHIFDVEDYIFVLALDSFQLSCSIKNVYGDLTDPIGYIRRFVDFNFTLPKPDSSTYVDALLLKYKYEGSNTNTYLWVMLKELIIIYQLSLRDVDKLFYLINLISPISEFLNSNKYNDAQNYTISVIYSVLMMLKIKKPEDYRQLIRGESINEVLRKVPNINLNCSNDSISLNVVSKHLNNNFRKILDMLMKLLELDLVDLNKRDEPSLVIGVFNVSLYDFFNLTNGEFKITKEIEFLNNFNDIEF